MPHTRRTVPGGRLAVLHYGTCYTIVPYGAHNRPHHLQISNELNVGSVSEVLLKDVPFVLFIMSSGIRLQNSPFYNPITVTTRRFSFIYTNLFYEFYEFS
jgi:hypothetical protein